MSDTPDQTPENGAERPPANPQGGGARPPGDDIRPIAIEQEMQTSYLDYAMSVIVSRALPDARDGLKPVHRRILYSMNENKYDWNRPYRKSARVVGDVIGKYHPHGDQSIYDALVRMVQEFSMRLPLIDGQGNFGSVDGDPPAAMRYTEVRMAKPAHALLDDLDKDTVNFRPNYDGSEREPVVLPARFPNLLVNGAGGIAVGMATNIPPHNLGEVIDGCLAYIESPDISVSQLMEIIPGPDFPTGGLILGQGGIRSAYQTGRGSVVMRGRVHVEAFRKDREALIVTELPYQVNKAAMIERIADLVREKRIEGISEMRDESDRNGMRIVIEVRQDAMADVVLNQLYRHTMLQTSFGANMLALIGDRPELMNLKQFIACFVEFREVVVTRRTRFELGQARDRAHVLVGLAIAVANIDEIIALIRRAPSPASARESLLSIDWPAGDVGPLVQLVADPRHKVSETGTYRLSDAQARAILELRLARLTALGREEIGGELQALGGKIEDYLEILRSRDRVMTIIREELISMRDEFATPRRSEIVEAPDDIDDEDLITSEDMVVTVTHKGYIKRVPLSTYRAQRRGGKGRTGMATREEDFVTRLFVANTHAPVLFFSSKGLVYKLKVWRLPLATPQARGKPMVNLLPLAEDETIHTIMPLPADEGCWANLNVMFATLAGNVRRNELADFASVKANGKIAMKLDAGDEIIGVAICTERDDILLTSSKGKSVRFPVPEVRLFRGRDSDGVRGIRLDEDDKVISLSVLGHVESTPAENRSYLRQAAIIRRSTDEEAGDEQPDAIAAGEEDDGEAGDLEEAQLSTERYGELGAYEQFILTVSENGYGKRSSAYEYRITRRGGKGIWAMSMSSRNGPLVAAFPVTDEDEVMLVTDGGQLIRLPVNDIRIVGRLTQGVTLLRTAQGERVVGVAHLADAGDDAQNPADDEPGGNSDGA
ncbi:MAG TPA: DNA gyrase subunit A [Alphaproteobacteria bacterium]|nr:DNA gyrase subunit A [Alphaproteobacteria bacterium]